MRSAIKSPADSDLGSGSFAPKGTPLPIIIVCLIGFLSPLILLYAITETIGQADLMQLAPLMLSVLASLICLVGLWQMKKWGAYGYMALFLIGQVIFLATTNYHQVAIGQHAMSTIMPAIVVFFALVYFNQMR